MLVFRLWLVDWLLVIGNWYNHQSPITNHQSQVKLPNSCLKSKVYSSKLPKDGLIAAGEAQAALTIFQSIPATFQHFPAIAPRALELATKYKWRYAYDGFYIALAEHRGCELWTADEKLVKDVSADFPFVKWLKDYQPKATGQPS